MIFQLSDGQQTTAESVSHKTYFVGIFVFSTGMAEINARNAYSLVGSSFCAEDHAGSRAAFYRQVEYFDKLINLYFI